jgi:hypothetical protein
MGDRHIVDLVEYVEVVVEGDGRNKRHVGKWEKW